MTEKERVQKLLAEYGFTAKKSFGQNFLINEGIIKRIITAMAPETFDDVIEIGPGLGALTLPLAQKAKKLIAVDSDRDMIAVLKDILPKKSNVTLVQSDFLRFNPNTVSDKKTRLFIGNLPYNITSELMEYLIQKGFRSAGAMVQKEVADKLIYEPGKKTNTPLGAFLKANANVAIVTLVDRSSFTPVPNVDSAFIRIDTTKEFPFRYYPAFKALFKDPNKTILNCLRQFDNFKLVLPSLQENHPDLMNLRARQCEIENLKMLAKEMID